MPMTIERVSEKRWVPAWVRHQHVERYRWIATRTAGCRVIDAACGAGFGAATLAETGAREVLGVDVAPEVIADARQRYLAPVLRFETASVNHLPVADHSCDAYVSLETIEHIADVDGFLGEALRVLKPGGTFYCSTPNRALTNAGTRIGDPPFNVFHLREYSPEELRGLLQAWFPSVQLLGQSFYGRRYARLLGRIGSVVPRAAVRLHQMRKLLGLLWERPDRHTPRAWPAGADAEVLFAICTAPEAN